MHTLKPLSLGSLNDKFAASALAAGGGFLIGLSFLHPYAWPGAIIGFALLFAVVYRGLSLYRSFTIGWLGGFLYLAIVHIWVLQTLPLDWLGISHGAAAIAGAITVWIFVSAVQGIFVGVWVGAGSVLAKRLSPTAGLLALALLLPALEYLRMWWIALVTWGPGTVLAPHYSLGFAGYSLASQPLLLQLASFGGIYLLSFTVVLLAGLSYWAYRGKGLIVPLLVIAALLCGTLLAPNQAGTESVRVALINVHTSPVLMLTSAEAMARFNQHKELLEQAIAHNPDIVIFPEDARFLKNVARENTQLPATGTSYVVLDSGRINISTGIAKSEMVYSGPDGNVISRQDKQLLLPYGEYMPYLYSFLLDRFGQEKLLANIENNRTYVPSTYTEGLVDIRGVAMGARFCAEILSPSLYADLAGTGAEILINLSSHSWFHKSRILHSQVLAISKVRAVENNRYLVRSANYSPGFVLDNTGKLLAESSWETPEILFADVPKTSARTLYTRLVALTAHY